MRYIIIISIGILILISGIFVFQGSEKKVGNALPPTENTTRGVTLREPIATLPDLSFQTLAGTEELSLRGHEGTILVINSWATWCPFCVQELPDFTVLQEEFGDSILVLAINREESEGKIRTYLDAVPSARGIVYLKDPKDTFYDTIGGIGMPETIFTDANGFIRFHKRGPLSLLDMRDIITSILNTQ